MGLGKLHTGVKVYMYLKVYPYFLLAELSVDWMRLTELYLSPVSDTHVCSTLSRLHYAPTLTVVPECIVPVSV